VFPLHVDGCIHGIVPEGGVVEEARDYKWELVANLGPRAVPVLEVLGASRAISRVRRATAPVGCSRI
jgi:hypothetical protein